MNENPVSIGAIIWDMDGTVFDTERLGIDCWEQICLARGYRNPRPFLLQCVGRNVRESNALLRNNFGDDFPVDALRDEKSALVRTHILQSGVPVKDGILDALHWIADKGLPCAIASSADHATIVSHLESAGLRNCFGVIVGGDEIIQGKPHPEIFLTVAEKLDKQPEHCLVFEDSPNGVIAAYKAGMRVAMIPDLIPPSDDIAPFVQYQLASGKEVIALLSKLLPKS